MSRLLNFFYVHAQFSRLTSPLVWLEAATQVFFSVGVGFGTLIAMASYNPIHNNCRRDAIFISLTDSLTSVFAAVVVFSVLGFKVCCSLVNEVTFLLSL